MTTKGFEYLSDLIFSSPRSMRISPDFLSGELTRTIGIFSSADVNLTIYQILLLSSRLDGRYLKQAEISSLGQNNRLELTG